MPSTGMAKTYPAKIVEEILEINLKNEKEAVDSYKKIWRSQRGEENLPYEFFH